MEQDTLYKSYDRNLYKIGATDDPTTQMLSNLNSDQSADNSAQLEVAADSIGSGVDSSTTDQGVGYLAGGKTAFDNTQTGYILGIDKGVAKFYIGNSTNYFSYDGNIVTIAGGLIAGSLDIPDTTTANSFHVDSTGNAWWGATTLGAAIASVTKAGAGTFSNMTITGGSVATTTLNKGIMSWTSDIAFTSNSATQINWSSGHVRMQDGTTYTTSAGNTGAMAAITFIYLDIAVSLTVLQTTTTYTTATGDGKILIATAQNNATAASVIPFGGGQPILDGVANIFANSITAASISTLTMTGKSCTFDTGTIGGFTMAATTLSATNFIVTSGAANVANVTVGTGATAGGINSANASGDIVFWAGSTFANRATAPFRVTAGGALTATSATISGYVLSTKGVFGGDGSDGALSGSTVIDLAGATLVIKNYTSISITGSAVVTFINAAAGGTTVIFKSQGNVTLTSSATPMIDCSGLGADGAPATVDTTAGGGSNGTAGTNGVSKISFWLTNKGLFGTLNTTDAVAAAATVYTTTYDTTPQQSFNKYPFAFIGAGGGSGSATAIAGGNVTSGAGSKGGGCFIIECAGAWNFTTTNGISVAGVVGGAATTGSATQGLAGGGGGSGAGYFLGLYNTLTANSGTVNVAGGPGGAGATVGSVGTNRGLSGGGGASHLAGTVVASADGVASAGGVGGAGLSTVAQNTQFA